jgi:CheY-like chemotaxis protein
MPLSGLNISRPDRRHDGRTAGLPTRAAPVLVVEDDVAIASALSDALQDEGLDVATAANGRDALVMLRNGFRPSAIVLDLMMPVMDGWDFRQEQLRDPALRDLPVVVMTAAGFSTPTIRAQFGNVDFLPKPVPFRRLLEILMRVAPPTSYAAL